MPITQKMPLAAGAASASLSARALSPVEHLIQHVRHVLRGADRLVLFDFVGAEFQQQCLRVRAPDQ